MNCSTLIINLRTKTTPLSICLLPSFFKPPPGFSINIKDTNNTHMHNNNPDDKNTPPWYMWIREPYRLPLGQQPVVVGKVYSGTLIDHEVRPPVIGRRQRPQARYGWVLQRSHHTNFPLFIFSHQSDRHFWLCANNSRAHSRSTLSIPLSLPPSLAYLLPCVYVYVHVCVCGTQNQPQSIKTSSSLSSALSAGIAFIELELAWHCHDNKDKYGMQQPRVWEGNRLPRAKHCTACLEKNASSANWH